MVDQGPIYTQNYEVSAPAFHYCMSPVDGYGITCSKWLKNNKSFFEQNGIYDVNYENLGMFLTDETYESLRDYGKKEKQYEYAEWKKTLKKRQLVVEKLYEIKKNLINPIKRKLGKIKRYFEYFVHYYLQKD